MAKRGEKLWTLSDLAQNVGDFDVTEARERFIDSGVIPSFRTPGGHIRVRVEDVAPALARAAVSFDPRSASLTGEQRARVEKSVADALGRKLETEALHGCDPDACAANAIERERDVERGWTPDELLSSREDFGAW